MGTVLRQTTTPNNRHLSPVKAKTDDRAPSTRICSQTSSQRLTERQRASEWRDEQEQQLSDCSDLSDSERLALPPHIPSLDLNLRAELIDSSEHHLSRAGCQRHCSFTDCYPDFLPPPFNSWNLKQLAVYLNTDGQAVLHHKPVGQLERFLDRLLQLEWHQVQTVQENSSKSKAQNLAQTSSRFSLSSPKCILHCQRGFSLTLLSSLVRTPTQQLSRSSCNCQARFSARTPQEKSQCSSERRSHSIENKSRCGEHRLGEHLSESRHLKRMQAVGNLRNPEHVCDPESVSRMRSVRRSRSAAPGRSHGRSDYNTHKRNDARQESQKSVNSRV